MKVVFYIVCVFSFSFIAAFSCKQRPPKHFTEGDILWQLDSAFSDFHKNFTEEDARKEQQRQTNTHELHYTFLPDLEHGYLVTAGSKIHLYADSTRWAIVFEKCGYENRGGDAIIELDYFGNCIKPIVQKVGQFTEYSNMYNVELISDNEYERIRNKTGAGMELFEKISPEAKTVNIRGRIVPIEHALSKYLKLGIVPDSDDNPHQLIGYGDLVRYYSDTNPALVSAEEFDMRKYLPADLPKIMTISGFHFESIYDKKNLLSSQETYRLIAQILVKRDSTLWKPKDKPNNHWSNWESGNL